MIALTVQQCCKKRKLDKVFIVLFIRLRVVGGMMVTKDDMRKSEIHCVLVVGFLLQVGEVGCLFVLVTKQNLKNKKKVEV